MVRSLRWAIGVQSGDKTVECIEHSSEELLLSLGELYYQWLVKVTVLWCSWELCGGCVLLNSSNLVPLKRVVSLVLSEFQPRIFIASYMSIPNQPCSSSSRISSTFELKGYQLVK